LRARTDQSDVEAAQASRPGRRGAGCSSLDRLQLWTFQRNAPARRFYEASGFTLIQETDGARNEENEPDALYLSTR
jgi:hypothetical protein